MADKPSQLQSVIRFQEAYMEQENFPVPYMLPETGLRIEAAKAYLPSSILQCCLHDYHMQKRTAAKRISPLSQQSCIIFLVA